MDKQTAKAIWKNWDLGDWLGLTISTTKWFFIWTFKGLLIIGSLGLVLILILGISMAKAKRNDRQ